MLHLASRARAENKIKDSSNFNICSKKTLTLAVKHTRLKYNTYYSLELGLGMYTVLFLMFFLLSFKKSKLLKDDVNIFRRAQAFTSLKADLQQVMNKGFAF